MSQKAVAILPHSQSVKSGISCQLRVLPAMSLRLSIRADYGVFLLMLSLLLAAQSCYTQTPDPFDPGPNGAVNGIAIQPDGKILIGGDFTSIGGQARSRLARLNAEGSLDPSFTLSANGTVNCLGIGPDGQVLVAGSFSTLGFQPRSRIGRFSLDGLVDAGFDPGASNTVNSLVLSPDGKMLVGGSFTGLARHPCGRFGRLNQDGTFDSGFYGGAGGIVYSMALQRDGGILVGGSFTTLAGYGWNRLGRFDADGNPDFAFFPEPDGVVRCIALQADGCIVVGGSFRNLGGQPCDRLGRLNSSGGVDSSFNAGASNTVYTVAIQADGRIIVGGDFTTLSGTPCNRLGRLHPDGTFDATFNPGVSGSVLALAVQADGGVLAGGSFSNISGWSRTNLCRLGNTVSAAQSLTLSTSTIEWQRQGSAPEAWRTTFDFSTNGRAWISLGEGTPRSGGWQVGRAGVPESASVRARAFITGARQNGSSWFTESFTGRPVIVVPPANRTNDANTQARFNIVSEGQGPISFQWRKGERALTPGPGVAGVQTSELTLSNVFGADGGGYSVVVSNSFGSVTSLVAVLTVIDPLLASQPLDQSADAGGTFLLEVAPVGSLPMSFQWQKDGTNLPAANGTRLSLSNLNPEDAGWYRLIVSNAFGCATSSVAAVTVDMTSLDPLHFPLDSWSVQYMAVFCLAPQVDERILLGGSLYFPWGGPRATARLYGDGATDPMFNLYGITMGDSIHCMAVLEDGRFLVSGGYDGLSRRRVDGALDLTFTNFCGNGTTMAVQADGKILIGGNFTQSCGEPRNRIARLNANGTKDLAFNPGALGPPDFWVPYVASIAVQRDGKIVVGGSFTNLAGQPRMNIGRIDSSGSIDASFKPVGWGDVSCLAVRPDGRIVVAGSLTNEAGELGAAIRRLNPDGSLDESFSTRDAFDPSGVIYSIALQADGKAVVAGTFTHVGGQVRSNLSRLNADGTLDLTFNPSANGAVGVALEVDGSILVAGCTTLSGEARSKIGRLHNTDPATHQLGYSGTTITWLRGGTSPEVWRTGFDASTDGVDWTPLGAGVPIAGGWQCTGAVLGTNAIIRARAYVTGGLGNGCSWVIEDRLLRGGTARPTLQLAERANGETNAFGFRIGARPGQVVTVERSVNLVDWSKMMSVPLTTNLLELRDPAFPTTPLRFYRAR
jgi:uncharacterized delta-60 repeat protein